MKLMTSDVNVTQDSLVNAVRSTPMTVIQLTVTMAHAWMKLMTSDVGFTD